MIMVADIQKGNNLYGALAYNQEKIDNGLGEILETNRVFVPPDGNFRVADCVRDFERAMPQRIKTAKPVIHISLNPHPDDRLSDAQLADIAREYLEGMGFGGQPFMVFKHQDIDRRHVHIVSCRVRGDGSIISDSRDFERSQKITDALEQKYGLQPKGESKKEGWQLKAVHPEAGNLKKQVMGVVKPLMEMYRFQTTGEYRALLSLYNIGIEEIKGDNRGNAYRGVVYSALDGWGERVGKPLKSSLLGKKYGMDALEKHFEGSKQAIKRYGVAARTRVAVAAALAGASSENEFRDALKAKGIDLVLRRNDEGRIYGATFIDHNERAVLNGSRLGKEFSANVLNERFADKPFAEDIQYREHHCGNLASYHTIDKSSGLFSLFTPDMRQGEGDRQQPLPRRRKKRKRRYGRQM